MSAFDYWYDDAERNDDIHEARDTHVKCNRCGKSVWWHYKDGWKLINVDSTPHVCNKTASPDEFEDMT